MTGKSVLGVYVPKSSSGVGLSRSVLVSLAVGIVSVAAGVVDQVVADLPFVDDAGSVVQFGIASIIAAFGLRRVST